MTTMDVHFSSKTAEYRTPQDILVTVQAFLMGIDLDPCADADRSVPARRHITAEGDGLTTPWRGSVFMNPPYGREIGKWTDRLCHFVRWGHVPQAIALVPARVDTRWWSHLALHSSAVCFVKGRIRFEGADNSAPFPSALVYLGPHWRLLDFRQMFAKFGSIWQMTDPVDERPVWIAEAFPLDKTAL